MEEALTATKISVEDCLNEELHFALGYAYLNSHTTLYTCSLLLMIKYMEFLWARIIKNYRDYLNGLRGVKCI